MPRTGPGPADGAGTDAAQPGLELNNETDETNDPDRSAALLIALILLAFTWKDIALAVIEHNGSRFFRDNFQSGKDIHVVLSKDDWAVFYFAGTKGLSDLSRLSTDPSLTLKGRELAKDLRSYIESGSHLAYIVELQKDQRLTRVMMHLVSRIKERDEKQATQPGH